jgi:hypothetical protein
MFALSNVIPVLSEVDEGKTKIELFHWLVLCFRRIIHTGLSDASSHNRTFKVVKLFSNEIFHFSIQLCKLVT